MNTRSLSRTRWIVALAGLGALLSLGLEYVHYRAYTAPTASSLCAIGARLDCTGVALSKWSVVAGIPLPVWGFAGFLALGVAAALQSRWVLPLAAGAGLASLVLLGVSAFSIGSFCLLCEGVHLVSFGCLALAWRARRDEMRGLGERDAALFVLGPATGVVLGVGLFLSPYWGAFGWKGDVPFDHGQTSGGEPWIGAAAPKLTIEEFVDYSCPHCRAASALTLRRLARHGSDLRVVRRYYPRLSCTERERGRCLGFRIAHCASKQDKFWQTDRWLFEHFDPRREYDLNEVSRDVGLDSATLGACVEAETTYQWAANVWRTARKLRVPGTPYYLVGQKLLDPSRIAPLIETL